MGTTEILLSVCLVVAVISIALLVILIVKVKNSGKMTGEGSAFMKNEIDEQFNRTRRDILSDNQSNFKLLSEVLASSQSQSFERQDKRLSDLNESVNSSVRMIDERFKSFNMQNEQKLDNIRTTISNRLTAIQDDNSKKLEEMRKTVDEKLQKTLEERIGQSFRLVSERLEQVYKGLGEMQTLASGVGDLKKVLSNVKTRGVLGEIQLGAILDQIMAPEQFEKNVETKRGSGLRVEYAVKMPLDSGEYVYLPIDAKFPTDAYMRLSEAYDSGDSSLVDIAANDLVARIKRFAKDINDKYIDPPQTTDFGIMFLPTEGLYAEVVRRGLVEILQRDYHVSIAGPTTMAALLNSLQMGFRTLAIQKRSSEVWNVLGAVKSEFDRFAATLASAQQRITQANDELDKLVGVRTRQIQRKLKDVTILPGTNPEELLKALPEEEND